MYRLHTLHWIIYGISLTVLAGCKDLPLEMEQERPVEPVEEMGSSGPDEIDEPELTEVDQALIARINQMGLNQHPQRTLPNIADPLPQLGMELFFSKSLGGDFDSACVSCHHPLLGGSDGLSMPVGTGAVNPDVLGLGRVHNTGEPNVPRNAPTVFNAGLWDRGLFHDSRVESLNFVAGSNGAIGTIRTPDSEFGSADSQAGSNLVEAQARFPVTSSVEMKGDTFEADGDGDDIRDHLAARIGNYGIGENELDHQAWLAKFQAAFGVNSSAEDLITYAKIGEAIGEYERSMVFVNHPWQQYMDGDTTALSEEAKAGALLFFTPPNQGGAGCVACHSGQLFSDEQHHVVAFPQIGFGVGDGDTADDDFGRERETGNRNDRYHFRTASLLNLAVTAPYGHSGSFNDLQQVVRHYVNPQRSIQRHFDDNNPTGLNEMCRLPQLQTMEDCDSLYPNAQTNSEAALAQLQSELQAGTSRFPRGLNLDNTQVNQLVAFLEALTDPCVLDESCLADWIPDESDAIDEHQLNAIIR